MRGNSSSRREKTSDKRRKEREVFLCQGRERVTGTQRERGREEREEEEEQEEMLTASEALLRVPARGDCGGSSGRGKDTEPQ